MSKVCRSRYLVGFTLLEVLIVLGLLSVLAGLGLFFALSEYYQTARLAEVVTVKELLQTARTSALHNESGAPHGVIISPPGYNGYILFQGNSFVERDLATQVQIPMSYSLILASSSAREVVFTPLSGTTSPLDITLIDPIHPSTSTITVNYEGYID